MTRRSVSLFINPAAGRGRTGRRMPRIKEIFVEAGVEVNLHASRTVGDLEKLVYAEVSAGVDTIIVAGGDGSVHEAVNGIMLAGRPARLGVIPSGTGNDFAKACAIPLDWEQATTLLVDRLAANRTPRRIDIGRMNDRYFANGAGVGFDAKVTAVARSYQWPIGDFVYLFAIFRCMIDGIATPDMTISTKDLHWSGPVTLVNVSNGPWVGGMFHIAPMANNCDGKLDLVIAGPVSRLRIMSLLPKLIRGTHLQETELSHVSTTRIRIEAVTDVPAHLDGEVQAPTTTFDIELLPAALDLL